MSGKIVKILILSAVLISGCKEQKEELSNLGTSDPVSPEGMVYVPAGSFMMGGRSEWAEPDEFPRRKVGVSAFYMDQTEVTNRQFQARTVAGGQEFRFALSAAVDLRERSGRLAHRGRDPVRSRRVDPPARRARR